METFRDKVRREWAAFKALGFRQKLEHIWIYYKWAFVVLAAVIAMIISLVNLVSYNSREPLISGAFINASTTEEGYQFLKDGYWEYCGANPRQRVELLEARMVPFGTDDTPSQEEAANLMVLVGMISSKTLDYVITNEISVRTLDQEETVLDLRELLPAETLAQYETLESETGIIAIKLNETAFQQKYSLLPEDSYVMVINNTPSREKTQQFLEYLLVK